MSDIPEGMVRVSGSEITNLANALNETIASHYSQTLRTDVAAQLAICVGVDLLRYLIENDEQALDMIITLIRQHIRKPLQGHAIDMENPQ